MTIATGSVLKKGLRTVSGAVDYFLTKDGRTRIIRAVVGNTYKASGYKTNKDIHLISY